ncbi:MAG: hypothetical protein HKN81_10065 [Gammaproteobacteria bacterium]|nr:hypothetical protein [Gammaproteobacteria bacterium]
MTKKHDTDDRDDELFNDDPTDELPILNLTEYTASASVPVLTEFVEELRTQLGDQVALTAEAQASAELQKNSNAPLREEIQDLEAYIDGRKQDWSDMHAELVANVRSIEHLTVDTEEAVKAKAELVNRVATLEGELETVQAELLGARNRIEELEGALATAEKGLEERRAEVHELGKQIDDQIEEQARRIAQLNETLDRERKSTRVCAHGDRRTRSAEGRGGRAQCRAGAQTGITGRPPR